MNTASTALICWSPKWDKGRGWSQQKLFGTLLTDVLFQAEHWSAAVSVETHSVLGLIKWLLWCETGAICWAPRVACPGRGLTFIISKPHIILMGQLLLFHFADEKTEGGLTQGGELAKLANQPS